jgi:hypothetical protein
MRVVWSVSLLAIAIVAIPNFCQATLYLDADFGTYANGALVGQSGWTQLGAAATVPLTVAGGTVTIPAPQDADNQDAWKNLAGGAILSPAVGTKSVYIGLDVTVNSAPVIDSNPFTSPSYFAAVYTGDGPSSLGFANERLSAIDNSANVPNTFLLAARITGQAGDPFTYGTPLTYGTPYSVVARMDMVAGVGNDLLEVFVNGVSNFTNPIAGGTDPIGMGAFVISQFAVPPVGIPGVTIGAVRMADNYAQAAGVPEPSTILLATGLLLGAIAPMRRRLK